MSDHSLVNRLKTFLGLHQPPKNDFRNPIWAEVDEDDDNELFDRHTLDIDRDPEDLHKEMMKQMDEMFKPFGGLFGDMKMFTPEQFHTFGEDKEQGSEPPTTGNIRDYYLKPGFEDDRNYYLKRDSDLDGKVSSSEISGLLNRNQPGVSDVVPFRGDSNGTRKSFFKTIITTSVKKPDGSVETRRIVKDQNGVVEETTTQTQPEAPKNTNMDIITADQIIINLASDLSSLWKVFN